MGVVTGLSVEFLYDYQHLPSTLGFFPSVLGCGTHLEHHGPRNQRQEPLAGRVSPVDLDMFSSDLERDPSVSSGEILDLETGFGDPPEGAPQHRRPPDSG